MASIVAPSFALANENSARKGENGSRQATAQVKAAHFEKKEGRTSVKNFQASNSTSTGTSTVWGIGNYKVKGKDNDNDGDEKRKHAYATSTTPIQLAQKTNYFLCKTDAGWNVVPVVANGSNNSANSQGGFCMKLPYGFAKKFYGNTPVATTTPPVVVDTVAPIISAISTTLITSTGANVSWTTNEVANGSIYFSTSTPVNVSTATSASIAVLSTAHAFNLSGLTASTTYHYVVKSADAAGNTVTGAEQAFTTAGVPDTTVPVLSNVVISNTASTTATVSWNTNEPATSSLKYGTSTPLNLATANAVSTTTVTTTHTFSLINLIANTFYNLFFSSTDLSNNTATTTASFTTTN